MNLIYDDITIYIILFIVALFAAAIDAIAGGGGLLVVPTMLLLGMNPLVTLGTNKLQSCFGTATSSYNYYKNELLKEKNIYLLVSLSFIGSLIGTLLVSQLSNELLTNLIPVLLISAAIFLILNIFFGPDKDAELNGQLITSCCDWSAAKRADAQYWQAVDYS